MKRKLIILIFAMVILILVVVVYTSRIYFPIEGTVVDAETKQPIEGAVVLAEWTITTMGWLGMPTTYPYKVIETVSDKTGKFRINTYVLNPIVNKPDLTIYKAGYVCWNNKIIFPDKQRRNGFRWINKQTYELERFKSEYSHDSHVNFISILALSLSRDSKLKQAYRWEELIRQKELKGGK